MIIHVFVQYTSTRVYVAVTHGVYDMLRVAVLLTKNFGSDCTTSVLIIFCHERDVVTPTSKMTSYRENVDASNGLQLLRIPLAA